MKIIYKNIDESISILIPSTEALKFATINQIAFKDVPEGLPFWIVEDNEIPTREDRDAWTINTFGLGDISPDGIGYVGNEFVTTESNL